MLLWGPCLVVPLSGDLYGSLNSIHSSSALIIAKSDTGSMTPAFARKYLKVTVILKTDNEERSVSVYLVAVDWLQPHPEKNWFHPPVTVWRKYSPPALPETFISVTDIFCRCAHLAHIIKFSRILEEEVITVVPVYNYFGVNSWT